MTKKTAPVNPFSHPTLANGQGQPPPPAAKGRSRIVPNAKPGHNVYESLPPALQAEQQQFLGFQSDASTSPTSPQSEVKVSRWSAGQAPAQVDPAVEAAASAKRQDIIDKFLKFKTPVYNEFTVATHKFRIKTLSPIERTHIGKLWNGLPEDKKTEINAQILLFAAALVDIDGEKIENPDDFSSDPVVVRFAELLSWNEVFLSNILDARRQIEDKLAKEYAPDFLKQGS